jgi:hypothetical protein
MMMSTLQCPYRDRSEVLCLVLRVPVGNFERRVSQDDTLKLRIAGAPPAISQRRTDGGLISGELDRSRQLLLYPYIATSAPIGGRYGPCKIDTGDRTLPVFFHAVTCDVPDKTLKRITISRELFRKMPLTLAELAKSRPASVR